MQRTREGCLVDAKRTLGIRGRPNVLLTSNSISGKDKIIASRAVDAIKDFVVGYLAIKGKADPQVLAGILEAQLKPSGG